MGGAAGRGGLWATAVSAALAKQITTKTSRRRLVRFMVSP
jgi:hypothetical protein